MVTPALPPPAVPPGRPQRLAGRYRLDRCLAIGGMAEVWLGTDEVLGRQVAVKVLHPNLATDTQFVRRLRAEAVAVARMRHPGIVDVYDTVSDAGCEAVVMEYVPGQTLRQVLDEQGRLEVGEAIRIGADVADALQAAHEAGIVHRDVKPGNILITPEGRVRLTDFGIATAMLAADELSEDGVLLGTAKYVAPEQVQGHLVDGRADLYSLAIVLVECLTGRVPYDGTDEREVALARLDRRPDPVHLSRPAVPVELDGLLLGTLSLRPSERPSTAAAFRDALRRIHVRPPAAARPTDDSTRVLPADSTRRWRADPTPPFGARTATGPAGGPGAREPAMGGAVARSGAASEPADDTSVLRTNQRRATWTIGLLLLAAVVACLVLILSASTGSRGAPATTTPGPGGSGSGPSTAGATTTAVVRPANAMAVVSAAEFDPPPGNGREHPDELGRLTDGREDTTWSTVCYRQPTMAPKAGTGLVFQLTAPAKDHALVVTSEGQGWSASVYVASAFGSQLDDWGEPVAQGTEVGPGAVHFDLGDHRGRYVLLWFTNLGTPTGCSLPYQLRVGEVAVVQS